MQFFRFFVACAISLANLTLVPSSAEQTSVPAAVSEEAYQELRADLLKRDLFADLENNLAD